MLYQTAYTYIHTHLHTNILFKSIYSTGTLHFKCYTKICYGSAKWGRGYDFRIYFKMCQFSLYFITNKSTIGTKIDDRFFFASTKCFFRVDVQVPHYRLLFLIFYAIKIILTGNRLVSCKFFRGDIIIKIHPALFYYLIYIIK